MNMGVFLAAISFIAGITGVTSFFTKFAKTVRTVITAPSDATDMSKVSLTEFTKPMRLSSRVYIDSGISSQDVITDVIKTVHNQYAAFVLAAIQLSQYVTQSKTIQDILKVVATEDYKVHESVVDTLFESSTEAIGPQNIPGTPPSFIPPNHPPNFVPPGTKQNPVNNPPPPPKAQPAVKPAVKEPIRKTETAEGKIVQLSGDNHIPSGKVLEVTIASPNNPGASMTLNLYIQLAPYIIPSELAVAFITKDVIPTFAQRVLQWKTGEISFWRDFVAMSDVARRRRILTKMDPTGVLADAMKKEQTSRWNVFGNASSDKADRARNIANSVMILSSETLRRAKAETGIDFTNPSARQKFFDISFSMIIVVIDPLYDQVTFYYNGIEDSATYSFDQTKMPGKGGSSTDLVSIMNAFNQGRSPRF